MTVENKVLGAQMQKYKPLGLALLSMFLSDKLSLTLLRNRSPGENNSSGLWNNLEARENRNVIQGLGRYVFCIFLLVCFK